MDLSIQMDWHDAMNKSIRFFKIHSSDVIKIRPIGPPCEFQEYSVEGKDGKWRYAICDDAEICIISKKYKILPKIKNAIQIINRSNGRIEIFKSNPFVFAEFKIFYEKTGKFPGATEGAQFNVSATGIGNDTKWKIKFAGPHVLSEEDIVKIKQHGMYNMKKIFAATDQNIIEKVLFGNDIIDINKNVFNFEDIFENNKEKQ